MTVGRLDDIVYDITCDTDYCNTLNTVCHECTMSVPQSTMQYHTGVVVFSLSYNDGRQAQ